MDKIRLLYVFEKDLFYFIKVFKDYLNIMEVIEFFKFGINVVFFFLDKFFLCMDDYILVICLRFLLD